MNTKTEVNPVQQALEEFDSLRNHCNSLEQAQTQLKDMNMGLLQENVLLRTNLNAATQERDQLRTYICELLARLDVITETIASAKKHSLEMTLVPKKAVVETPKVVIEAPKVETLLAETIIDEQPAGDGLEQELQHLLSSDNKKPRANGARVPQNQM